MAKNLKNARWIIRTPKGAIWGQSFNEVDAAAFAREIGGTFYRVQ